ncbi:hypothetical protein JCM14469_00670 [Desulfatiferula olefinivorans]
MEKTNTRITVFHCINAFRENTVLDTETRTVRLIKMPCSGMITEVFLLKAFEAGADAVAVLVCPGEACRYMEGSTRASRRIDRTRQVLDDIGLGGFRLSLHTMTSREDGALSGILDEISRTVRPLTQNPAAA